MRHTMAYRTGPMGAALPEAEIRLDYKPVVTTRYEPMERKY
jgi:succinate dehydrogenase flavoprotein subunit